MRTLRKTDIEAMRRELKLVENLEKVIGGGNGSTSDPYTYNEYESMIDSGSWRGGFVEGMGYVGDDVQCCSYPKSVLRSTGVKSYDLQYSGGFSIGFALGLEGGVLNAMAAYSAMVLSAASAGTDFGNVNYDMIHFADGIREGYRYAKEYYGN